MNHVRYPVPDRQHPKRQPKAHWPHPTLLGARCNYMNFTDDHIDPNTVPANKRCGSFGCREAWQTWDKNHA